MSARFPSYTGKDLTITMDLLSIIVLCAAIALAFILKVNTGFVAMAAALVLCHVSGITEKWLIAQFGSSLFIMLLGVMYLFCIAQDNKTLDLLAKKVLALCKGKAKLFPLILFLMGAILSAIGPGLISVTALMAVIIVALAKEIGVHPIKLLPFGTLGSFAGGLSPITPSGIVAMSYAEANGIFGLDLPLSLGMILTTGLYSLILYFFVFKWQKHKTVAPADGAATQEKIPPFTLKQWATLAGIVITAVLTTVFKINVGLAAFAVAVVLTAIGAANEGNSMKRVPWGTLVMITGVGMLISLVTELGGIKLLENALNAISTEGTAAAIKAALAGVMSWVSSASGVVMPTLIPTVSSADPNAIGITVALCVGAHMAALSPLSSCGSLMLSAYSTSGEITTEERNKVFGQLFAMSAAGVAFGALLALTGVFGLFG